MMFLPDSTCPFRKPRSSIGNDREGEGMGFRAAQGYGCSQKWRARCSQDSGPPCRRGRPPR
jgi:hypothetical protein